MHLLRHRDFALVWTAAAVSWAGDGLAFLAFMWLAYDAGGASGVIVVRLTDSIPSVVVGLGAGVVADRVDRRRLMIGADLLRAAALGLLVSVAFAGRPTVLALAISIFLLRIGDSFFEPAAGAMLPDLVPRGQIQPANALLNATDELVSAVALGCAGLLLTVVPLQHFFTLDAGSFLASALLLAFMRARSRGEGGDQHPLAELTEGLRELTRRHAAGIAMVMFGLGITIGAGIFIPAAPSLVAGRLGAGAGSFGAVMLGFAAGAIAVAAVLGRRRVRGRERASILFWIGYAVCFVLFAVAGGLPLMVLAAAAAGAAESGARILLVSALQHQVSSASLGRVMAVFFTVHRAAHGVGLVTVGLLVTALPLSQALAIGAALELVSIGGCLLALRGGARRAATV